MSVSGCSAAGLVCLRVLEPSTHVKRKPVSAGVQTGGSKRKSTSRAADRRQAWRAAFDGRLRGGT